MGLCPNTRSEYSCMAKDNYNSDKMAKNNYNSNKILFQMSLNSASNEPTEVLSGSLEGQNLHFNISTIVVWNVFLLLSPKYLKSVSIRI